MRYCARCLYPENARPTILFDEEGVCSGCRYHESRKKLEVDWGERKKIFERILSEAKDMARQRGNSHDCIVPVSGGKDSHYQVWLLKTKYGMNPLMVSFNHAYNTAAGTRNLENLSKASGCDLVRFNCGLDSVRRVSRHMLETVGDLTWHYHAGITGYPFQVAVQYNIPLIVWGEHGFAELTGMVSLEDFVEHTRWKRKEHDMRGYDATDLIGKGGITLGDISPYIYPTDEQLERSAVRGIYLSNFFPWNAKEHAELMIKEWGFSPIAYERERTFNLYGKIEDHANDLHDYLKYLKFGYGRATDDASMEIRHGRMTREEAIAMVKRYDANEPTSLGHYCEFLGITKERFYATVEKSRDPKIWRKPGSDWVCQDSVVQHEIGAVEESNRVVPSADRALGEANRHLYYNPANPPKPVGETSMDVRNAHFNIY